MKQEKKTRTNEEIIRSIKSTLDDTVENLDAEIRSRLTTARYQALARKNKKKTWLVPTGVFASLAAAIMIFTIWFGSSVLENPLLVEDMELLSSSESFELLEELEFYEWLGSQNG